MTRSRYPETAARAARPLRVMQSFSAIRRTTNPYIVQLDHALAAEPSLAHRRFTWRGALISRIDVIHMHWPEILLEGDRRWKRWGKRILFRGLLIRLRVSRIAVVRTAHNLELPRDLPRSTERLLIALDNRTDHRIVLNRATPVPAGATSSWIPHGHYREWFAAHPRPERVRHRVGFVGLIRRYKGVESLLRAYRGARADDERLTLRIGGRPSSEDLSDMLVEYAESVPGVRITPRFLEDTELVEIVASSQLIVLPYVHMHNSGGVLAALSLDRPVLVPRNEVNTDLAAEVGPGWVHTYDGELTSQRLLEAMRATSSISGHPDLSLRGWETTGAAHAQAYTEALRRAKRRSRERDRRP